MLLFLTCLRLGLNQLLLPALLHVSYSGAFLCIFLSGFRDLTQGPGVLGKLSTP
jgi:hypothetical protein